MSYNLKITAYTNRDSEAEFSLKNDDDTAYDLTGCKLVFGFGSADKTLGLHSTDSSANKCVFITDATTGAFRLSLPYVVVKNIEVGTYNHDLILIDADSKRIGIWVGQLIIKKGFS